MDSLAIHNLGYIAGAILTVAMMIFSIIKYLQKREAVFSVFGFLNLSILGFYASHLIGVNVADPQLSQKILLFNVNNILITLFNAHFVFLLIEKAKEKLKLIAALYISGLTLIIYILSNTSDFLKVSVPKLYLPNYYEPGYLYVVMNIYMILVIGIFMTYLILDYKKAKDLTKKNRIRIILYGFAFGWIFGLSAVPLVYDIEVDPVISSLSGIYTIFFAYAMVKYEFLNVRVIAKKALSYALLIGSIAFIISMSGFLGPRLSAEVSFIPSWVLPLFSAFVAVVLAMFTFKKLREADMLRHQFIDTISHKFRTPLTYIKWATDSLKSGLKNDDSGQMIADIEVANQKLVQLTEALIEETETKAIGPITSVTVSMSEVVEKAIKKKENLAQSRQVTIESKLEPHLNVEGDSDALAECVENIIDNAVRYSSSHTSVIVTIAQKHHKCVIIVEDSGVGFSRNDGKLLFEAFYRSPEAQSMNTEGLGLALHNAKRTIEKYGGSIRAESKGINEGSRFMISLPLSK